MTEHPKTNESSQHRKHGLLWLWFVKTLTEPELRRAKRQLFVMVGIQAAFMILDSVFGIKKQISDYFVTLHSLHTPMNIMSSPDPTGPIFYTLFVYTIVVYLVIPPLLVYKVAPRICRLLRRQ